MEHDDGEKKPENEADESLWQRYTADIDKIGPVNVVRSEGAHVIVPKPTEQQPKGQKDPTFLQTLEEFGGDLKPMQPIASVSGNAAQIDKRTTMRLKRGQMPIDARIDLHGLYQRDAKTRLLGFIMQSSQRGDRCVLVITGKGKLVFEGEAPDSNTPGVIKRNFKSWLAEEPYASMILKIEKAQIKDGGEGAYYILLRRNR